MTREEISGKHIAIVQAAALLGQARGGMYFELPYCSNPFINEKTMKAANDELDRIVWNLGRRADRLFTLFGTVEYAPED